MKVKLLKNILENGGVKVSRRHTSVPGKAKDADGKEIDVLIPGFRDTVFVAGAIIDMSDASGAKYVDNGWAEEVKE